MVALLIGDQQRTRRKVGQFGAMTFLFWKSKEISEKSRPTQKFWPPQNEIFSPLEQRSSSGTGTAKPQFAAPLQPSTPGAEPEPPNGCNATGTRQQCI